MLRGFLAALALLTMLTVAASGLEYVVSRGRLSDDDFFRSVACGAPPGGPCFGRIAKWSSRRLGVAIIASSPGPSTAKSNEMRQAIELAIAEINATGAGITLKLVPGARANIRIYLVATPVNGIIRGTHNHSLDGHNVAGAFTSITWAIGTGAITEADIAISGGIGAGETRSIVLEELTQSLGLMYDIRNAYYDSRSIFSEDSNAVTRLRGQDLMALRRLYAAR